MMKKVLSLLCMALCVSLSCKKYDDSLIWDKLNDHEDRIAYLEEVCKKMNADIINLQTIVSALETNDYIVNASPLVTGDGYTFTFKSGKSVVIYDGKDGVNGSNGKDGQDGVTPIISIMKDVDGIYYWTVNGEWLIVNGKKVKASATDGKNGADGTDGVNGKDGVTPKFKIENDDWYVSYDNGESWEKLGKATGSNGVEIIKSCLITDHFVTLTLYDGTMLSVPKHYSLNFTCELLQITLETATFGGIVDASSPDLEVGIVYSLSNKVIVKESINESTYVFNENGEYLVTLMNLKWGETYYYRTFVYMNGIYSYSDVKSFTMSNIDAVNLNISNEYSNCYIISEPGRYKFGARKGNTDETIKNIACASVVWESFGTSSDISVGDLIKTVVYDSLQNVLLVQTTDLYRKGNALVAVKDRDGNILWSWHLWFTDSPKDQIYYNEAGILMDRNLGATSSIPGDVCALGLRYQWGRKDPMIGSSSLEAFYEAKTTAIWDSVYNYPNTFNGTIDFAIAHSTTLIMSNNDTGDWLVVENSTVENTRWATSLNPKSIYDPCPIGYRVPDGGPYGVWAMASGTVDRVVDKSFDTANYGVNMSKKLGSSTVIWYPVVGHYAGYWSSTPYNSPSYAAYTMNILYQKYYGDMYFTKSSTNSRAEPLFVRCQKEVDK